jgi:hypothetical protein
MPELYIALVGFAGALLGIPVGAWVQRRELRQEWVRTQRFTVYTELDRRLRTLIHETDQAVKLRRAAAQSMAEADQHEDMAEDCPLEGIKALELRRARDARASANEKAEASGAPAQAASEHLTELSLEFGKYALLFSEAVIGRLSAAMGDVERLLGQDPLSGWARLEGEEAVRRELRIARRQTAKKKMNLVEGLYNRTREDFDKNQNALLVTARVEVGVKWP